MKRFNWLSGTICILIALVLCFYVGGWIFLCLPAAKIFEAVRNGAAVEKLAVIIFKILICFPITEIISFIIGCLGIFIIMDDK